MIFRHFLWKPFLVAVTVLFWLTGLNAFENWLHGPRVDMAFFAFIVSWSAAVVMTLLGLKMWPKRFFRLSMMALAGFFACIVALDIFIAFIVRWPSTDWPDLDISSREELIQSSNKYPGVIILEDNPQWTFLGMKRNWTRRWKVPLPMIEMLGSDERAELAHYLQSWRIPLDQTEGRNPLAVALSEHLLGRWPDYTFFVTLWGKGENPRPTWIHFFEDNRLGKSGVYMQRKPIRNLFSPEELYERWLSYRNAVVFLFQPPVYVVK